MRTLRFGPPNRPAEAIFLILEAEHRVDIVRVYWIP